MLTEDRHKAILEIVRQKGSVTVTELTELLNISESTVRRDLSFLNTMGKLNKVHGGATAIEDSRSTLDFDISLRMDMNREEKEKIAKYAASFIQEDDFVYIDAGSTTEILIEYISQKNASYITNGISHAKKLISKGFKTFIIGGEIKAVTQAVVGTEAVKAIERYNFTLGFFGTNGVDIKSGYTTPDVNEALIKEKAFEKCKNPVILCDSTKFGKVSCVSFGKINRGKIITTETNNKKLKESANIVEVYKL